MKIKTKLIIIIILSILAFFNSFYLVYDWFFQVETTLNIYQQFWNTVEWWWRFCDLNKEFSCTTVANSEYSKLFWIPFGVYAMFMFFLVILLSTIWLINKKINIFKFIVIPVWAWVITNFYLFYLEIFVIGVFCPVCIIISILLFSIFFISLYSILKCTTKQ